MTRRRWRQLKALLWLGALLWVAQWLLKGAGEAANHGGWDNSR